MTHGSKLRCFFELAPRRPSPQKLCTAKPGDPSFFLFQLPPFLPSTTSLPCGNLKPYLPPPFPSPTISPSILLLHPLSHRESKLVLRILPRAPRYLDSISGLRAAQNPRSSTSRLCTNWFVTACCLRYVHFLPRHRPQGKLVIARRFSFPALHPPPSLTLALLHLHKPASQQWLRLYGSPCTSTAPCVEFRFLCPVLRGAFYLLTLAIVGLPTNSPTAPIDCNRHQPPFRTPESR